MDGKMKRREFILQIWDTNIERLKTKTESLLSSKTGTKRRWNGHCKKWAQFRMI